MQTSDTSKETHVPKDTGGKAFLYAAGVLVFVLILIGIWAFISNSRETLIKDTDVRLLSPTYTKLEKKLVSGELHGMIKSPKPLTQRSIALCHITKGEVIKKGKKYFLYCPEKSVKTVPIEANGNFQIRLQPGSYFLNMQLEDNQSSNDIPARVNIHTGERAEIKLVIQ